MHVSDAHPGRQDEASSALESLEDLVCPIIARRQAFALAARPHLDTNCGIREPGGVCGVIDRKRDRPGPGGKDPGGFSLDATDVFTEGVIYPCLKLVHRGELRRDGFDTVVRNNRFATFAGDIAAMIGGVQHAVRMLETLIAGWGADVIKAAINQSIEHTERRVREEVARWPDGTHAATVFIDHDTAGTKDIKVHVTCTIAGDQLTVDLTGTDDRPELVGVQDSNILASGAIVSLIDTASGTAVWCKLGHFQPIVTLDLRLDYLRPALEGETVIARCECYKLTKSIAFVRGVILFGISSGSRFRVSSMSAMTGIPPTSRTAS